MKVSVIIPTYNGVRFLGKTIESVFAQTFVDWELVIVDDGSQDCTPELAQTYVDRDPRVRLIRAAHGNVAAARNMGVANASTSSEYIAFLDHDDLWEPDTLATLVRLLEQAPDAVAAHGLARFIDTHDQPCRLGVAEGLTLSREAIKGSRLVRCTVDMPTTFDMMVYDNCLLTPGQVLVRRAVLDAVGPLDPQAAPVDDYDLWLRLCARGPMVCLDRVVVGFRQHETNQSNRLPLMQEKDRFVRRKLIALPELSREQRRLARTRWRVWYRHRVQLSVWYAAKNARNHNFTMTAQYTWKVFANLFLMVVNATWIGR